MRHVTTCIECGLRQYWRETCRRCERPLSKADVIYVERVVEKVIEVVVEMPCLTCSFHQKPLPTLAEVEGKLYVEAYARVGGDVRKLATLLGVGKTTAYRRVRELIQQGLINGECA
jgi:transcriptional regulator with PAS, ATPase and Fis domain